MKYTPEIKRKIAYYQKKIDKNAKDYKSQLSLGKVYLEAKNIKQAILHLIWAQKLSPKDFETNYSLALAYFENKDFEKALDFAVLSKNARPNSHKAKDLYQLIKAQIKHIEYKEKSIVNGLLKKNNEQTEKKHAKKIIKDDTIDTNFKEDVYNFCDGYCKDCKAQSKCKVFQQRLDFEENCRLNDKDPDDIDVIIDEIESMLNNLKGDIEEEARSLGVEIRVVKAEDKKEAEAEHKKILTSGLFRKAKKFTDSCLTFLDKAIDIMNEDPLLAVIIKGELEKISHYGRLCEPKIYRALTSNLTGVFPKSTKTYEISNFFVSLSIAYEALNVCQTSLNLITEIGESAWAIEMMIFATDLQNLKASLIKKYPQINLYRKKIIINAQHEY